ncbi:MAG: molecular chaperone DnaJ [Candidatus Marinimicrobia bacterium]|jgi:molecular chaperone DnaJ|nr:molecular chaperone DnaJ [Candidatus Neomarinimicrobiota bacterium]
MRDFYEILGVDRGDSSAELKRAYRKIALKYHPDKNPGDKEAEKTFKEAAEAYGVLSDSNKRAQYDQFGHAGVGMGQQGSGFGGGVHMSMDDIFSQFGDIFGGDDILSSLFGGGRRSGGRQHGKDIRIRIQLKLEDIASGVEKTIKIKRSVIAPDTKFTNCPICHGHGQVSQISNTILGQMRSSSTCPQCRGSGKIVGNRPSGAGPDGMIKKEETIKIKIPAGVEEGNYMTVDGKGNEDINGVAGNLNVLFEEKDHEFFIRNGDDVFIEAHIAFSQAALGTTLEVPTLDGKAKLKIPAGIQAGQILRMRSKGFPRVRQSNRGDQLVKIQVETPKKLSKNTRKIFQELAVADGLPKNMFKKIKI